MRPAIHYLTLIQRRDKAQDRYYTAFRNERRLRAEYTCAVQELQSAKEAYASELEAMKADPAALAAAE